MLQIIHKEHELCLKSIRVKKPYSVGNRKIFVITHNLIDPLLIQTPAVVLPYNYSLFDNNYFQIDILVKDRLFISLLDKMVSHIWRRISIYEKNLVLKDWLYIPKELTADDCAKIRLKNENVNNVSVFTSERHEMSYRNLSKNDMIQAIFQIEKIIVDLHDNCTFYFKVLQIKKCFQSKDTIFNKCIMDNDTDVSKYEKMLSYGISVDAVCHKMQIDSIGQHVIDYFRKIKTCSKTGPPPPPPKKGPPPPPPMMPPPPPPPMMAGTTNKTDLKFLQDIKSGNFKLRKSNQEVQSNKLKLKETLKSMRNGLEPPSLEDILAAKSRLIKLNK